MRPLAAFLATVLICLFPGAVDNLAAVDFRCAIAVMPGESCR